MHILEHSLHCKTPTGSTELVRLPMVVVTLLEGNLLMCYWEAFKTDQRSLRCVWSLKPSFSSLGGYIYGGFWLVVIIMFSGTLWHFIHSLCCTLFYLFMLICQNKSKRKTVVYSSFYSLSIGPTGARDERSLFLHFFLSGPIASMCGKYSLHWVWVCCSKVQIFHTIWLLSNFLHVFSSEEKEIFSKTEGKPAVLAWEMTALALLWYVRMTMN